MKKVISPASEEMIEEISKRIALSQVDQDHLKYCGFLIFKHILVIELHGLRSYWEVTSEVTGLPESEDFFCGENLVLLLGQRNRLPNDLLPYYWLLLKSEDEIKRLLSKGYQKIVEIIEKKELMPRTIYIISPYLLRDDLDLLDRATSDPPDKIALSIYQKRRSN